jgi:RNA polymerase subunit RPABC4/transcription elongation factor Spt4
MESTGAKQAREKSVNPAARSTSERPTPQASAPRVASAPEAKSVGYGLPCSRCHAYYPADMHVCPICKSPERVSPTAPMTPPISPAASQPATGASIDSERERLLKELKSQAFASHTQINAAATFRCVLEHQHSGATEPAAVCHTCYGEVRQQADRMEAALHMDAKEAAKIVYEAVWADTSDPNTTYLNAATALLSELRKRAGIGLLLGANQPLAH